LLLARSLEAQGKLREAYDEYRATFSAHASEPGVVPEPPYGIIFAMRELEKKLNIERKPVTATLELFFQHELYAQTPDAKAKSPFTKAAPKLIFDWKSTVPIGEDPLGIRWIAEDVPGVERNHVIATAKSEPNKQSGHFSLTKPTAGFPTGKYRVEIWQSGKEVYREEFEILP
jgi:hypothetical protein